MPVLYPNIVLTDDAAGPHGESLEECSPLLWPKQSEVDEEFVKLAATRLLASSFRSPDLIMSFVLPTATLSKLLRQAAYLSSLEPTLLDVTVKPTARVHVVGDIHGDFHSLMETLERTGLPSPDNLLVFTGDYVDRGSWGVEVLALVLLLKVWRPNCIFLVRGNHETTSCIQRYGFEKEVMRKFSAKVVPMFTNVFRQLPLAAVIRLLPASNATDSALSEKTTSAQKRSKRIASRPISQDSSASRSSSASTPTWGPPLQPGERRFLALHAGLFRSPEAQRTSRLDMGSLVDIEEAVRREDDPMNSVVEDLLWSDPQIERNGVDRNRLRGAGILFGPTAFDMFMRKNNLHGMVRAHEGPDMREKRPKMNSILEGYSVDIETGSGFLATIFSSADYPPQKPRGNRGAFATFYGRSLPQPHPSGMPEFTQFDARDRPVDFELFYTENDCCLTPRQSFS